MSDEPDEISRPEQFLDLLGKGVELYQRSPVVRMIVKLYPPATVVEAGVLGTYEYFRRRRMLVFADELQKLNLEVEEDKLKDKQFFDAFSATARRVLDSTQDEKIRMFAHLFTSFVRGRHLERIDEFEEVLSILDDLSLREFQVLLILQRHETAIPDQPKQNKLERANQFWNTFSTDVEREVGLPKAELAGTLARLNRTGLYQTIVGAYLNYGGDRGYLTPLFARFIDVLDLDAQSTKVGT
jgi:hypothetical protein